MATNKLKQSPSNALMNVIPVAHCLCANIVGNLDTNTFEDIWNGEKMIKYRKEIISGNIEKVCQLKKAFGKIPYELLSD